MRRHDLFAQLFAHALACGQTRVVNLSITEGMSGLRMEGDPISHFALTTADYQVLGGDIAGLGLPTVIAMEGGYAVEALGANVASFLDDLLGLLFPQLSEESRATADEMAARLAIDSCGWYAAEHLKALVSAARWVAGNVWRGHDEALARRVEKLTRRAS